MRQLLKPIVLTEDDYQQTGRGYKQHGVWEPSYIDSHWVFSKYLPGTHFGPHYDGATVKNFGERSLQTIIIYLNDGCVGGSTNFFDESKQSIDPIDNNNLFVGTKDFIIKSISPAQGSALVFHHYLLHEGELLKEGYKYILRSDIIYKRYNFPDTIPAEREGIDWLIKAQQFEFDKNWTEATRCYKKAFRLYPELEFIKSEV
jgi:tetratricopeptide (TPR) repeat protein